PNALFSVSAKAFPCVPEEREPGIQLAIDEDTLATIDLRGGYKPPTRVGVNAQKVSYLVRSTKRGNDNTDRRPKCKREKDENKSRSGFKAAPNQGKPAPERVPLGRLRVLISRQPKGGGLRANVPSTHTDLLYSGSTPAHILADGSPMDLTLLAGNRSSEPFSKGVLGTWRLI